MNRRNFLKRCSILPFVGSLAAVAKSKAPMCATEVAERYRYFSLQDRDIDIVIMDEGFENAFVYGGKLFRVFPGYFDERYVMMSLREGRYENNRMIRKCEFDDMPTRCYLHCEIMLKDMEKEKRLK